MWNSWGELVKVEAENRPDKVLVAAGLAQSVSEATRLIKGGGVTFKVGLTWEKITNPRTPISEGRIVTLKIGKTSWRLVPREGRDGWDGFPTWREIMFPLESQEFEFWKSL
jgi:ribosomal protein S4